MITRRFITTQITMRIITDKNNISIARHLVYAVELSDDAALSLLQNTPADGGSTGARFGHTMTSGLR